MKDDKLFMDDGQTRYDSLVNDINNRTIFVINRDYRAVPCFILLFTLQQNEWNDRILQFKFTSLEIVFKS